LKIFIPPKLNLASFGQTVLSRLYYSLLTIGLSLSLSQDNNNNNDDDDDDDDDDGDE